MEYSTEDRLYSDWLPVSREEIGSRGWDVPDIIIVSGDAYVDHPSFGHAVIARVLDADGFRVAILPQPNWRDDLRDFKKLGRPRLFFGITSGNMDSMVNHYTANKRLRSDDAYTPGGQAGFRPDYAVSVYTKILKSLYPDTPVVIGGVEASLRRFTHYDYWSDQLMPSILDVSGADILVYGMGEKAIREIAHLLNKGIPASSIRDIPQTAFKVEKGGVDYQQSKTDILLKSHSCCISDKRNFAKNFAIIEKESNRLSGRRMIQESISSVVYVNPPFPPMTVDELDAVYTLGYTRMPHPRYRRRGKIPAWEMIRNSINIHRGCFGGCSFCTISAHQGKFIQSRSEKSILKELNRLIETPGFNGIVSDLGGPSANMYFMSGIDIIQCEKCIRPSCLYPAVCKNLNTGHKPLLELYRKVRQTDGVKHLFIGSGIRYDLFIDGKGNFRRDLGHDDYMRILLKHHVSGRLKVAPEHCSPSVLSIMRKPSFEHYRIFKKHFDKISLDLGKRQQLIPYFITGHPGSRLKDMVLLSCELKKMGHRPEQTQDFTPTPMTLSAVMYYTGIDPYTMQAVHIPKSSSERLMQNKLIYWYKKENADAVRRYLAGSNQSEMIRVLFETSGGKKKKRPSSR